MKDNKPNHYWSNVFKEACKLIDKGWSSEKAYWRARDIVDNVLPGLEGLGK